MCDLQGMHTCCWSSASKGMSSQCSPPPRLTASETCLLKCLWPCLCFPFPLITHPHTHTHESACMRPQAAAQAVAPCWTASGATARPWSHPHSYSHARLHPPGAAGAGPCSLPPPAGLPCSAHAQCCCHEEPCIGQKQLSCLYARAARMRACQSQKWAALKTAYSRACCFWRQPAACR